jgi:hypothetical protein
VHIGLGWALSQRQVSIFHFIRDISPIMQSRVLDGVGYYEGMFRNRTTIRDKVIPDWLGPNHLHAYDQGIGRALWYIAKGNTDQLLKLIDGFSDNRKPDLWRGIGIAASYVGGCDEAMLISLYDLAASYQVQLASGAVFLAHSRQDAHTMNPETEFACRAWCHMSVEEVIALMDRTEPSPAASDDSYIKWVKSIEEGIRKSVIQ